MDDVRLPDLEVIRRYSIAVRREHAPAEEIIAALRADLAKLTGSSRATGDRAVPERAEPSSSPRTTPARSPRAPARKSASKSASKPARKPTRRR